MSDTPRALPVISEATVIRTKLGTLVLIASGVTTALVGGTLFVARLSAYMETSEKRLTRIESALGIEEWRFVPPTTRPKDSP